MMKIYQQVRVVALAAVFLLLSVSGCKPQPGPQSWTCPDVPLSPHLVVVVFLDRSLSILKTGELDQLTALGMEASRLIQHFPPGTRVVVRLIGECSYCEPEHAFTFDIPAVPPAVQCQAFDARCHLAEQRRQALHGCVNEARDRLSVALRELKPQRATKTDVWGAMAAASDVLNAYPQSQRLVVIYSDLLDTVGTPLPNELPGLATTPVMVRMVKNSDPKEIAQRLAAFRQRLAKWNATVQELLPDGSPEHAFFAQPSVVHMPTASQ